MPKNCVNHITLIASAFLFICALYIYISNRSPDMILYSWLGINSDNLLFEWIRKHSFSMSPIVKYNVPDGLWMLSFLLFVESVWGDEKSIKWMFCVPIIAFACTMEILQFLGYFPGTGDVLDIFSYVMAILLFILLTKLKQMYYEKNN